MTGLVNEITIQYALTEPADQARAAWKQAPPSWMTDGKYKLVDESYNGLVYRANVSTFWQRLLTSGFGDSFYSLSLRFESDGRFGSRVTITGQAPEKIADAIRADAAAHGGGIDPRYS